MLIPPRHMRSWQAKTVAISFICLILLGNLWITKAVLGVEVSSWIFHGLVLGVCGVFLGGAALMWKVFMEPEPEIAETDLDDQENATND